MKTIKLLRVVVCNTFDESRTVVWYLDDGKELLIVVVLASI